MKLKPREIFNLQAKTVAETFDSQFPDAEIDTEYTENGWSDLPKEARETGTWREFHDKVANKLAEMRGE